MSDECPPHLDDAFIVETKAEPETEWLLNIWSSYCAEQGLPDGTSEAQPMELQHAPWFLESLRLAHDKYEAGNLIALLDALHICRSENLSVPDWVLSGMERFMLDTITKGAPGKRGRCNNPLARARQAVKQQKQRAVIDGIRLTQKVLRDADDAEDAELFYALMLPNEVKDYFKRHGASPLGRNLQDAVEVAEKSLRGTEFQATFSTLERLAKSTPEATFEVDAPTVREALGIDVLDKMPGPYGPYQFMLLEELSEEAGGGTDAVKEKPVFWLTIRRRDMSPVS